MSKPKKVKKNSYARTIKSRKLIDALFYINKVRVKFDEPNEVVVNKKIKIVYETFNVYVYVNGIKYLRVVCGNNKFTNTVGPILSVASSELSLGILQKTSPIEILAPDDKVHEEDFFKNIEKQIVDFYPKYKTKIEKESEKRWINEEDKEAEDKARKEFYESMEKAYNNKK